MPKGIRTPDLAIILTFYKTKTPYYTTGNNNEVSAAYKLDMQSP